VRTSLKLSGLSSAKTLDSFDFAFQRGVDRGKVELLATCEFARRRDNVLLLGPPGVGKTHLATGLGTRAVQNGFSVAFMSADELVEQLRRDDASANRRPRRRKYMSSSVLIVDELGFQALDRRDAHLLFKVISYRYERGSTIITSNKSIREWPEMLAGDDALATAILDRILHHCHVLNIDGRSFRLREIERQLGEG
jgi:DNA replication protein DnaC